MNDQERLEEIKINFGYAKQHNVLGHGWENGIADLIKQAEEKQELEDKAMKVIDKTEKFRVDLQNRIDDLEQQNKRYEEALTKVKNLTKYDDGTEEEVYNIVTEALQNK